jgi:molybdopterin-guanine dinucleotide biosynthesis protein B
MKIVSVIGFHNSGKTTVVESIIKSLKELNYTVSSIKDIHNENFTMEKEGSNSQRHLKASQTAVFARGQNETYLIWNRSLSLSEMLSHLDSDFVIIEGMNNEDLPKIIVATTEEEIEQLMTDKTIVISGPVSETIDEYKGLPCVNAISNTEKVVKIILKECEND